MVRLSGMTLFDDLKEWSPERETYAAPITAASLRARATNTTNRDEIIARYVASIKDLCFHAADQGHTSVDIDLAGSLCPPYNIRDAIKCALESDGFKVTYCRVDCGIVKTINVRW